MNKFFKSLLAILAFPLLMLLTGCDSEDAFSESTVKLELIDIAPSPITTSGVSQLTLTVGNKQPFEAVGHYSDGSSQTLTDLTASDWHTNHTDVGRFDEQGVFTATNEGSTTLTASKDGITSNTVDMTVSAAVITSIQVTPSPVNVAKGQTQQLVAMATYSDTTSSDISSSVTWTPVDTTYVTVTSGGLLSGVDVGSTTVTATKDGITSNTVDVTVSAAVITSIQVTPSPVYVAKGQTQQLVAMATYSDTTSSDISSSVTWTPVDTTYVTVTSGGLLSGVDVGSTTVTATKDGITSNTVDVTVSAAVITSIQVTPSPVYVAKGQTQQLVAMATYSDTTSSDISSSVTWTPVDTTYVTVTSGGLLSGVDVGSTTVTATKDGITSNTVDVTVSAAVITSIQVTPSPVNVAKGQTQQLVAMATYSDTTSSDISSSVTWTPVDTTYVTVTSGGLLSGVDVGSTTVTATKDGITSNTVDVTVSAAVITSIQVTPSPVNVAKGQTQQLVAMATYSDTTSSDISSSVTWTPVDITYVTVTSGGLLSGVDVGSTTVTATKDGITSNTVDVTVYADLAGASIDLVDTGNGKLFTSTPSVTYLNSLNGSIATDGIFFEPDNYGPTGYFYLFSWNNANALCATYNTQSVGGRTNWRLATKDELKWELYDVSGNMFTARGWPTSYVYWSVTSDGSNYYSMYLSHGHVVSYKPSDSNYASCVSDAITF
ncbi:Ig-like domain-containing protein [Vibrio crassostreae]|uniref:Ig-like domain-containing protein n=1 Tax=Vibrio crassostreae TaxID=246167 RepID=UPI002E17F308|nr:Ig-like domain-containing protein [Vibrio crassostreae]